MYSFFSPPSSPQAPKFRRSTLPSSHKDFYPRHHQHRSSRSSWSTFARLSESPHQRRRFARSALFLASLLVICWVVVSRNAQTSWLSNLNRRQGGQFAESRSIFRRDDDYQTRGAAQAVMHVAVPAAHRHAARPVSLASVANPPLTPTEELAAIVHFIASNHHAILPPAALLPSYSPSTEPLQAEWVLDFEPGPAGQMRDAMLRGFIDEVWTSDAKFVVLGREKTDGVFFRELKTLLTSSYNVAKNEFVMLDIEGREDAVVLYPLLQRLLATPTLPSIILGGTLLGSFEDVKAMHEAGTLQHALEAANVQFNKPQPVGRPIKVAKRRLR